MNLHGMVSGAINTINPMRQVTLHHSTGYTTADDGTQVPTYGPAITAMAQIQDLNNDTLKLMDGLNIQGVHRNIFLNGNWNGVIRADARGGDKIIIDGQTWLVTLIPEGWPDWSRLVITLQTVK